MERRRFGKTGLDLSVLGFGCGAVGGLMVKGTAADQERGVARALQMGINYFDTAPSYGDGLSERNLGRVLGTLRPDVVVGTKVRLADAERGHVAEAVAASLEASLRRLGRERVDLLQLHNPITRDGRARTLDVATVEQVVAALEKLRQQGKIRFAGITALGDTNALHRVIDMRVFDTAQVCYNLLNPSAGQPVPPGFPAHDFGQLLTRARAADMGTMNIRVLAGGALSGEEGRHPHGVPVVEPIASGTDYAADVRRGRRFDALVREGHAGSVVEASLRFAIANPAMTTVLVGYSTLDQLEYAAAAIAKGPLPRAALDQLPGLWRDVAETV
ncbi:MAG: aldo/keto reductase [Candidatus Rokubacteria bacterium]|nr:aldo/keto reductase [Candidatus Rokubacteria bacterium]